MSKFFRLSTLALAAGTMLATGSAHADTIAVSATVQNTCEINSAGAMAFNNVNFLGGDSSNGVVAATSTIQTTCTADAPYKLTVDGGINGTTIRQLQINTAATDSIDYVLGKTAGASDVDFAATEGNFYDGVAPSTGLAVEHTLHGTATVQSSDPAGTYEDTLTVTIAF